MNLIEPVFAFSILGGAIGGAAMAIHDGMGPLFAVVGALVGALAVPAVLITAAYLVIATVSVFTGRPYWPACTACGAAEFTREAVPGPPIMRCECGQLYVRNGRQCRLALPGGASQPHLRWHPLRGWTRDPNASSTTSADLPYRDDPPDPS